MITSRHQNVVQNKKKIIIGNLSFENVEEFKYLALTPEVPWLSYSPLDPRTAGSNPAEVEGLFERVKTLSMTSFGREVKPWVPCRRFTARKRTSSGN